MPDTLLGLCRITFPPACSLAWLLRLVLVVLVVILATVALQVFSLLILLPIDQVFGSIALDEGPIGGAVPWSDLSDSPAVQQCSTTAATDEHCMTETTHLICNGHVAVFRPETDSKVPGEHPESISKVPTSRGWALKSQCPTHSGLVSHKKRQESSVATLKFID